MKVAIVYGDDVVAVNDPGSFCAALARHGHDVAAYKRRRNLDVPDGANGRFEFVSVCVGPAAPVRPREVLPFVGDWAAELDRRWSTDPPEVVHAFGWLGGLAAQLAAKRHGLPTVQSFYGLAATSGHVGNDDSERARLEPLLTRGATRVTGGSTDEADSLAKLRHTRASVSVLSTGVDVERYKPVGPKECAGAPHRIVQFERDLLPHSGFDKTIGALPRLPETELIVAETVGTAGRSKCERIRLQRLADDLGVTDRVHFVGAVGPIKIPSLIRSADVVACTPMQAPNASSALQAMGCGVVVVGVAVGALIDTVISGVTGLLVSPNNPQELAAALKTVLTQTFQRESMASSGRSRALSRFSWDRIALDALHLYHQASSRDLPHRRGTAGRAKNAATA